MKISEILSEVTIDNNKGWGSTSNNQNVDYLGLRVKMKPSVFLRLAAGLGDHRNSAVHQHLEQGGAIAAPFLNIRFSKQWLSGDTNEPAHVYGHEGRNRMTYLFKHENDMPIEVHLFFGPYRNRNITPAIIAELNARLVPEKGTTPITGPFFELVHQ